MFMDLAGHEKYLKTTVFGLTGNFPDYCMLLVGANMGVIGMTKEHFHLTLALKVHQPDPHKQTCVESTAHSPFACRPRCLPSSS